LRPAFEGLPPPTDAEQRGLAAALEFSEAKANVEKQLAILDTELGKATDDDKKTQLSLAVTVQALEALVPVWATVFEAEPAHGEQLQRICGNMESWAVRAASSCPTKKVDGLLKFAEAYDDRRLRLAPPEPEGPPLRRRIAEKAAEAHLKSAESELAKDKGLNPIALLESLRSGLAAFQNDVGMETVRDRLSSAFEATTERVAKTFSEALAKSDTRREDMLQQFSVDFDEVWTAFKEAVEVEDTAGLASRLAQERERVGSNQVAAIRAALLETGKADFAALLQALTVLKCLWPKLAEGSPLPEQVSSSLGPLEEQLDRACNEAAEAGSIATADELLRQAGELDAVVPVLVPERHEDSLHSRAVSPAISARVGAMEAAVEGKHGINCAVVTKELLAVQPLVQDIGCSAKARKQVLDFISGLEAPLVGRLVDGGDGKAEAEFRVAAAADETLSILGEGTGLGSTGLQRARPDAAAGLRKRLEGAAGAAAKLGEMRGELAKPSGMNPTVVVQALQTLEPVWPPVAEMEAFRQRLAEALERFHERLQDACRKALGIEAKVKALLVLAEDADAKQQVLAPIVQGVQVRSFRESLARVIAGDHLKAVEAELAKESGMNAAELLKRTVELGNIWPQIGKAESGPAYDSITDLHTRVTDVGSKVQSRMKASFQESKSAGNTKKMQSLLNFAREFDAAYGPMQGDEPGDAGGLLASLEAEATS